MDCCVYITVVFLPADDPVSIANESDQVAKGHLVNALAHTGDEGRDTLR